VNDWGSNGVDSFEVKTRTDAAKLTNIRIARFGQRGYPIRERKVSFVFDIYLLCAHVSKHISNIFT